MNTKEKIIDYSLTLFSIYGFKGTSVKMIADSIGIKDSSLYKHIKSKNEILDLILIEMKNRVAKMSENLGLPSENDYFREIEVYGGLTLKKLTDITKRCFLFYLKDDFILRFWKMANMEQYHNKDIFAMFHGFFIEQSVSYQERLFTILIDNGDLIGENPKSMAMIFYSPIFLLLSHYQSLPEKEEEAISLLENHVKEFYRIYKA